MIFRAGAPVGGNNPKFQAPVRTWYCCWPVIPDLLQDIPVLDNPVVLDPEYVHDRHSPVLRLPDEMTVDYHEISFGDKSSEIEMERGKRPGKSLHERDEYFSSVCRAGIVLPVIWPQVFFHGFFRFFEIQCKMIEIPH